MFVPDVQCSWRVFAVSAQARIHCVFVKCRVKFDKDAMSKTKMMVSNLKSTGQSKFALEEKEEVGYSY